jgi:hypothetical protein
MRISEEEGNPARLTAREGAHENVVATVKNMPLPFMRREFVAIQVCASDDSNDDLLFAGESVDEKFDYGTNFKTVRGTIRLFARFRSVSPNSCRLTFFAFVDPGGRIPTWVLNREVVQAMVVAESSRLAFDRSDEVDKMNRDELAGVIECVNSHPPSPSSCLPLPPPPLPRAKNEIYTKAEDTIVDRVRDQLGGIPDFSFEKIESLDHFVHMEVFQAGGKNGIARASTDLDEDICTCAAWSYGTMSRQFVKEFYADGGLDKVVTKGNDHSFVGMILKDFNIPTFSPREFVSKVVWRWESETVLLVVTEACLANQYPIRPGIVRGSVSLLEKFERLDALGETPQTRITWTQQPDLGGLIPSQAVRGAAVGQMMYVRRE